MIVERKLYALDDVTLIPAVESNIRHRSECNVKYEDGKLPVFVSPMDSVIDINNFDLFEKSGLISILPRTESLARRIEYATAGKWAAFGMEEFEKYFCDKTVEYAGTVKALIDIANGHIKEMQTIISKAKETAKYCGYTIEIMAGNVANPDTYRKLSEAGADYVRCSVGSGGCCFIDGTQITLSDGTKKNIENVNIGDIVIAHDGKCYPVENIIRFKTDQSLITINKEITCTEDHKFYVINKADKSLVTDNNLEDYAYWVSANKLDINKHLLIKQVI